MRSAGAIMRSRPFQSAWLTVRWRTAPVPALQGRGRRAMASVDLERLTEYELWKHLSDVLNVCTLKNGTCEQRIGSVGAVGVRCDSLASCLWNSSTPAAHRPCSETAAWFPFGAQGLAGAACTAPLRPCSASRHFAAGGGPEEPGKGHRGHAGGVCAQHAAGGGWHGVVRYILYKGQTRVLQAVQSPPGKGCCARLAKPWAGLAAHHPAECWPAVGCMLAAHAASSALPHRPSLRCCPAACQPRHATPFLLRLPLQYMPVMGLDGNAQMVAFLGGVQGMPMGLPSVRGQRVGRARGSVVGAKR